MDLAKYIVLTEARPYVANCSEDNLTEDVSKERTINRGVPYTLKHYLQHWLPSSSYRVFAQKHRAWQRRKEMSAWRTAQIAIALESGEPNLPSPERECFYAELKGCRTYLEYGSGGSTLAAVRTVPCVVSVENDRAFHGAVTRKARSLSAGKYFPIFVNTGRTSEWGEPIVQRRTAFRRWLWRRYAIAPWIAIERNGLSPDLILIDGRFRVACALESLLRLPSGSSCRILLDDFEQYDGAYFPIFDFTEKIERHGRAVILRRVPNFDQARCRAVIKKYYEDFR
jgi:hypothetical protein